MRPLGMMAWGIGILILDFRINGFDFIVDVVGWVLCAIAAAKLSNSSRWFRLAMWGAIVGGLASLSEITGAPLSPAFVILETLAQLALAWGVCSGIIESLSGIGSLDVDGDQRRVTEANRVRWTVMLTFALISLMVPVLIASTSSDSGSGIVVLLVLVGLVTYAWFLSLVFRLRDHPFLQGGPRIVAQS